MAKPTAAPRARLRLEFKQEAVHLVEGRQRRAAVGGTLGVVVQTQFNGVNANRQDKLTGAGSKTVSAERMEITRVLAERALSKGSEVKCAFLQRHQRGWLISVQCRVLKVSVAGSHERFSRRASNAQRRHLSDDALLGQTKAIQVETHGGYGWPRTWKELVARGIRVEKDRMEKLMQLHGVRAKGEMRRRRHDSSLEQGQWLRSVGAGHVACHAGRPMPSLSGCTGNMSPTCGGVC